MSDGSADGDQHGWVMDRILEQTSPEPDGKQGGQSNVWTGKNRIKAAASKVDGIERGDVADLVAGLESDGKVIDWHGLIAPADDEHLLAIIESEKMSDAPRKILVKKCNNLRNGDGKKAITDGGEVATGDHCDDEVSAAVTRTEIAMDQLEYLREKDGVCAQVSISAGCHPWYRWNGEAYEVAETMGYGKLEVDVVHGSTINHIFAENPVEIMPVEEATFSTPEPGRANVWDRVEADGEEVTIFD